MFELTLAIKLRNFSFQSHWNVLIFFEPKEWCQIWICPFKQCLIWFKLRCFSRILAIGWEIQNLNFVDVVLWLWKVFLSDKKMSIIPPLFYKNRFVTDFKEKAELVNFFISKQFSLISNDSSLTSGFRYISDKCVSTFTLRLQILEISLKISI